MDKLNFESFYKFLVSVGTVLFAVPIIGFYCLLKIGNSFLLSKNDYNELSHSSMIFVQQRDQLIKVVFCVLPWVLLVLFLVGLFCLIFGSYKWSHMQKLQDFEMEFSLNSKRLGTEVLSGYQFAKNVLTDIATEKRNHTDNNSDIEIENSSAFVQLNMQSIVYTRISKAFSKKYILQQNVSFNSIRKNVDMLAYSKNGKTDLLFEFKCWKNNFGNNILEHTVDQMKTLKEQYESITQRKCKCILFITTTKDNKEIIQNMFGNYFSKKSTSIIVKIYAINELKGIELSTDDILKI